MKVFKKLILFFRLDLRSKLIFLSKKYKKNFYPKQFKNNFYSKFIFNLIFFEKALKFRKIHSDQIFKQTINYDKLKIIVGIPRSGNNYLDCLIRTYQELKDGGNGIPKYLHKSDVWLYSDNTKQSPNMYNAINFKDDKPTFDSFMISNHPLINDDLLDYKKVKPLILIRNPKDIIKSLYWFNQRSKYQTEYLMLNDLKKITDDVIYAFKYWKYFINNKINNKDYYLLRYEDLLSDTSNKLIDVLNFFNIEVDYNLVEKSIEINSIENHRKLIGNKMHNIRFTDKSMIKFDDQIDQHIVRVLRDKVNNYFDYNL